LIKRTVSELTLNLPTVACKPDSSSSVQRISDGSTVSVKEMLSVRDTETVDRQFNMNLKRPAAQCHRSY
jgi:hypothetical protein